MFVGQPDRWWVKAWRDGQGLSVVRGVKHIYEDSELFVALWGARENVGLAATGAAPGKPGPEGADGGC